MLEDFLVNGIQDEEPYIIAAMEEVDASWMSYMKEEERAALRLIEIEKLETFGCFIPRPLSSVEKGVRIFGHTWVDTEAKSRLTVKDLRRFGTEEQITCPTPSYASNSCFDYVVTVFELEVCIVDVVSAFPHAGEPNEKIYMRPPIEWSQREDVVQWLADNQLTHGTVVWHLLRALYGRRSAGANFRDFWEAIICTMDQFKFARGDEEPCIYYDSSSGVRIIHHIDDGRIAGPRSGSPASLAIQELSKYMLLKVSDPVEKWDAVTYLGRKRVRLERGWMTIPDGKHRKRILEVLQLDTKAEKVKVPPTPGIRRPYVEAEQEESDKPLFEFRSATGSMIFLSSDVESIAFATKELARHLHKARICDWHALARLGRYLIDKEDYVTVATSDASPLDRHLIAVEVDANWASDEDGRSTSAVRIEVDGFRIVHASQTQPGLPSLSTGEAELRANTRGACEGLYVQKVLQELGVQADLEIETDAAAALQAATKMSGGRLKHLAIADKFIREALKRKLLRIKKKDTRKNSSDIHSKHVDVETLRRHLPRVGWRKISEEEKARVRDIKLKPLNRIGDVMDADLKVANYESVKKTQAAVQALELRSRSLP